MQLPVGFGASKYTQVSFVSCYQQRADILVVINHISRATTNDTTDPLHLLTISDHPHATRVLVNVTKLLTCIKMILGSVGGKGDSYRSPRKPRCFQGIALIILSKQKGAYLSLEGRKVNFGVVDNYTHYETKKKPVISGN